MYQQMNENAQMGQATAGVQQMQPQVTMEQQQVQTPQYEVLEEGFLFTKREFDII